VRIAAARAVAKAGATTPDVLAALHALAADPSPALRAEAERLLAALPAEDAAAIEALGASLSSPSAAVREGAVRGLLPHGADAEGAARDALSLSDERGWEPALRLLATLGPHASVQARHAALAALETATTVPVQAAALRAMGAMHAREPVAVRAVMDRVAAREPAVRDAAIAALGDLAADDKKAFEKLHDLAGALDKEDRDLRLAALRALGRLGEGAQDAMNVFKKGMEEDDEEVRDASITGMAALGRAALKTLIEGMDSASDVYRRSCLKALGLMGAEARSAVPELMDAIENGRNWGVHDYADVLAHIGKKAVGPLKRLLRSDNVYARGAAARALGRIGPDAHSARRALEKLLEDTSKTVRDEAKKALVQIE
jgi:hypothetical protein